MSQARPFLTCTQSHPVHDALMISDEPGWISSQLCAEIKNVCEKEGFANALCHSTFDRCVAIATNHSSSPQCAAIQHDCLEQGKALRLCADIEGVCLKEGYIYNYRWIWGDSWHFPDLICLCLDYKMHFAMVLSKNAKKRLHIIKALLCVVTFRLVFFLLMSLFY